MNMLKGVDLELEPQVEDLECFLEEMAHDDVALFEDLFGSDEEIEGKKRKKTRSPNKERDFVAAIDQLTKDYFSGSDSVYDDVDFARRFRVSRAIFNRIHSKLIGKDPFIHKQDFLGNFGIHPLVKLVACFRYVAYGDAFDREDENLRLSETSLKMLIPSFCKLIIQEFGAEYLNRSPTESEKAAINQVMTARGFPGCLGSWDCKHFVWKNCPMRLAGQHKGHAEGGKKTLILEALADHRRYFWQVNFGDPGCLNDINILDKSSIVGALMTSDLSIKTEPYEINGNIRDWMYFLVDGIYPDWSIFVSTYTNPIDPKKRQFAVYQERVRKDIECAFGILVQRFHVLQRPLRGWYQEDIVRVLHTCVILHNMVVEEKYGFVDSPLELPPSVEVGGNFALFGRTPISELEAQAEGLTLFSARLSAFELAVESTAEHLQLKSDLVEHISSLN
jgi:Plant transposon protein